MKFLPAPFLIPVFLPLLWLLSSLAQDYPVAGEPKEFDLNGRKVKVTHQVDPGFYGRYSGTKSGFLLLKEDGTGEYQYDVQFPAQGCEPGAIKFDWGMLLNEKNEIVRFERDYGFSYPIILVCTGNNCFQGCRVKYMVDYILDKKQGKLEVSSSDDWEKSIL